MEERNTFMNTKKTIGILVCLLCLVLLLCACGLRKNTAADVTAAPVPTVTVITPAPGEGTEATITATDEGSAPAAEPAATPIPVVTQAPVVVTSAPAPAEAPASTAAPAPVEVPVATAAPAATPAPAVTPAPTAAPTSANLPVIRKSPTNEDVLEGGSAWFVAKYDNALWAVWHFVSPDGQTDLTYEEAGKQFPTMGIRNGMYSTMELSNIPLEMNNWKVYCRYSNRSGYSDTNAATVTVTAKGNADSSKLPVVTKSPTSETVNAGGSAYFVAKYKNATWAVWHFVSPDGQTDLSYVDMANRYTALKIIDGDRSTMQLKNIPSELNGWKVYCAYTNNFGTTNTDSATITIKGAAPAPVTPTAAPATTTFAGTYTESHAHRGVIEVTGNSSLYQVKIHWAGSAAESSDWNFAGAVDASGVLQYTNCTKVTTTMDSDGSGSFLTEYTDGTGKLTFAADGSSVTWVDDKENIAAEAIFVKG